MTKTEPIILKQEAQSGQPRPARSIQSILAVRSPSPPGPTIYTPIAAAAELIPSPPLALPSPHPRSLTRVLSAAAARWCSASPTGSVTATRPSPTRPGSWRPQVSPICSFLLDLGGVCGFLICVVCSWLYWWVRWILAGGKLVYQYTKKRASGPKCPVTGKKIQGVSDWLLPLLYSARCDALVFGTAVGNW